MADYPQYIFQPGNSPPTGEAIAGGIMNLGKGVAGAWEKHEQDLRTDASNEVIFSQAIESGEIDPQVLGYKTGETPSPAEMYAKFKGATRNQQNGWTTGLIANYMGKIQQQKANTAQSFAAANASNALAGLYRGGGYGGTGGVGPAQDVTNLPGWKSVFKPGRGGGSYQLVNTTTGQVSNLPSGHRLDQNNVLWIRSGPKNAEHVATMPEIMALMMTGAQIPGLNIGGGPGGQPGGQPGAQPGTRGEGLVDWITKQIRGENTGVPENLRAPDGAQPAQPGPQGGVNAEPPDGTTDVIIDPATGEQTAAIWRTGVGWVRAQ